MCLQNQYDDVDIVLMPVPMGGRRMKKTIICLLAIILLVQSFVSLSTAEEKDYGSVNLNSEKDADEITVFPAEKAYVRDGNEWKNMNWLDIIEKRGLNQNGDEPLILKVDGPGYNRYIYFTFDISEFDTIPYKKVFFKPNFNKVGKGDPVYYDIYKVSSDWKTDTITWSTQPERGAKIASMCIVGAVDPVDLTDAVDAALLAGENKLSFVLISHPQSTTRENRIDYRGTTLTATVTNNTSHYTKKLVADEKENAAIWSWAQTVYDSWYERYQYLLGQGISEVDLIPVDETEYTKTIVTTGEGQTAMDKANLTTTKWKESDFNRYEPTRTVDSLIGLGEYSDFNKEQQFDIYGGLMDNSVRQEATGFFYSKKIGDRWWIIDPLGYPCYIRSMANVRINYLSSANHKAAALEKYGQEEKWGIAANRRLKNDWYFNATTELNSYTRDVVNGLIYQEGVNLISTYGEHIGTNVSDGGSTDFAGNNTMNVFDPEFIEWCDTNVQSLADKKDDKWMLGRTIGNELPMDTEMLYNYLRLSPADPTYHYSYACAWTWFINMTGNEYATLEDVSEEMLDLFVGFVYDRYFSLATAAIKKYDPNHMILGTRMLTDIVSMPWALRFSGLHLDILTINWYNEWDIPVEELKRVSENSNLPLMVTEFYTKAVDSGLENTTGAGWLVKTQQDRGDFYQCFTLRLLECKNFVGWQWFQYIDNDPSPETIYTTQNGVKVWKDESSIDVNKGIVDNKHDPYEELVDAMTEINKNVYKLIEHFDSKYASQK